MKEVQGAAACSFIPPSLLQDPWPCVQPMCPECDASCKRELVLDKARSTVFTAQRQSHDQTDLQCKARECCYCQIKPSCCLNLKLMTSSLSWERKGFAGLDTVQRSRGAIKTVCDMQIEGKSVLSNGDEVSCSRTQHRTPVSYRYSPKQYLCLINSRMNIYSHVSLHGNKLKLTREGEGKTCRIFFQKYRLHSSIISTDHRHA